MTSNRNEKWLCWAAASTILVEIKKGFPGTAQVVPRPGTAVAVIALGSLLGQLQLSSRNFRKLQCCTQLVSGFIHIL